MTDILEDEQQFGNTTKKEEKTNKKQTLDALHKQKLKSMQEQITSLPTKLDRCSFLKQEINLLTSVEFSDLDDSKINLLFQYEEELRELEEEIADTDEETILVDYFVNTSDILYKYYDNMECISSGKNKHKKRITNVTSNENSILNFFGKKHSPSQDTSTITLPASTVTENEQSGVQEIYVSRQKLLDNYLQVIDSKHLSEYVEETDQEICPICGSERTLYQNEALMLCKNRECGNSEIILLDSNKPSYKDPPREMSFYSYKRINHFNEWLAQFQAKETTDINEEVYNCILLELKKERVNDMAKLTHQKMKDILKKLGFNKYYEHIPHIINRLNGLPAPVMSRETEEKLRSMFREIQAPFIKHCPEVRKNFLSYSYVLHKLCQLLELDEFLHCFPMLKSREKLYQQDVIWEKICEDLEWEFIKSI